MNTMDSDENHESVKDYYGSVLKTNDDLKTNACCVEESIPTYLKPLLSKIHDEVMSKFYGCGSPVPAALSGQRVLDLGSGSGRDCYVFSQLVGESGSVVGIDMTDEQIEVAKRHLEYHREKFGYAQSNVDFRKGYIEDLKSADIKDDSIDVITSNCVLNLAPNKKALFQEIFRVLKPGGELYFSDVFAGQRIPKELAEDPVLLGECLGGAMYIEDFRRLLLELGCADYRIVTSRQMKISDPQVNDRIGMIDFYSITIRAFKIDLEDRCEDYGQVAYYRGGLEEAPHEFVLDDHHVFKLNRPTLVCGNTADMLSKSRFQKHFEIRGEKKYHLGLFGTHKEISQTQSENEEKLFESIEGCC